jgi:hypothetical protein
MPRPVLVFRQTSVQPAVLLLRPSLLHFLLQLLPLLFVLLLQLLRLLLVLLLQTAVVSLDRRSVSPAAGVPSLAAAGVSLVPDSAARPICPAAADTSGPASGEAGRIQRPRRRACQRGWRFLYSRQSRRKRCKAQQPRPSSRPAAGPGIGGGPTVIKTPIPACTEAADIDSTNSANNSVRMNRICLVIPLAHHPSFARCCPTPAGFVD